MGIIEFVKAHQLNIMLFMSGICGTLTFLTFFTGGLSARRKHVLILMESASMLLLLCDRWAYLYRGDITEGGYWMVRICNFVVYLSMLVLPYGVTLYFADFFSNEGQMKRLPKRLTICKILFAIGVLLLIVSRFTGLFYTFDAQNQYQRAPAYILFFFMPLSMVIIQLTVLAQYHKVFSNRMLTALSLHLVIPALASVVQLFVYGVSLTNMTTVGMAIFLYLCAIYDMNESLDKARANEIETFRESRRREHAMFEQTAEALASAIDAKDEYTHGHSSRVATYSELIAREAGLSEEEIEEVYFAALLHDVGKIGVADAIINKEGRLTDEEFAQIKLHPVFGNEILSRIRESPYLSIGAHYHHERYDGRGYPEGLAGKDIPRIARIIAVADAYDAMTSQRSYRDVRPQHLVREELVKGIGTQFDPRYAKIMLHCMDLDHEYQMHQQLEGQTADLVEGFNAKLETQLRCDSIGHECSTGIRIINAITRISFVCTSDPGFGAQDALPTLILFDSLDGMVHESEALRRDRRYFEYARIRADGLTHCTEARKAETSVSGDNAADAVRDERITRYDIEAVRIHDHMQVRISDGSQTAQAIVALPFSGRFSYISLTGEHCELSDIKVQTDGHAIDEGYIPRITEEVSYIRGCPEGDIPNIQIDGQRAKTTQGIRVTGAIRLKFHARSLPNARLIWHCPYVIVFSSRDGVVGGDGYREFVLVRLNGEELEGNVFSQTGNKAFATSDFGGWDAWKGDMKKGIDCEVVVKRVANRITVATENLGICVICERSIPVDAGSVYVALTGDQCAITNIRVLR